MSELLMNHGFAPPDIFEVVRHEQLLYVRGVVNRQPALFLLRTGAACNLALEANFAVSRNVVGKNATVALSATDDAAPVLVRYAKEASIELTLPSRNNMPVEVRAGVIGAAPTQVGGVPVAGIVGCHFLRHQVIRCGVDFFRGYVAIEHHPRSTSHASRKYSNKKPDPPPVSSGSEQPLSMPLGVAKCDLPLVSGVTLMSNLRFNTSHVDRVLVDTGLYRSYVTTDFLIRAGVPGVARAVLKVVKWRQRSVQGNLRIADQQFKARFQVTSPMKQLAHECGLAYVDGALGTDLLRKKVAVFDWSRQCLTICMAEMPP